jgi:hypothetical protein
LFVCLFVCLYLFVLMKSAGTQLEHYGGGGRKKIICLAASSYWALSNFSVVLILYTVGRHLWTADQSDVRPLLTHTQNPWSESANELYRPSDHSLSANLVPNFADRGFYVVSVTDPYGSISRISRPEPLFSLSNSSSIVLTRLSGPRSRRATSQKIW